MEKVQDMKKTIRSEGMEDSDMKGVSSLLKMKEGWREDGINGKDEGLNFVLRRSDLVGGLGSNTRGDLRANSDGSANGEDQMKIGKLGVVNENERGDAVDSEEYGYSIGDFVWGKIKSHPWWPGRVYDPSDASDYAAKIGQQGKLLVAYFGDGTFAWCHPSQLRPFGENFEEMMNQSSSKAFHHAVEDAMEEISKLVNLKMTCTCVRIEKIKPFVVNCGVKQGVMLPNKGIDKLGVSWTKPADVLTSLRRTAQLANSSDMLKLSVLKGWVGGFYNVKTGYIYNFPEYVEPEYIIGLEDQREENSENGIHNLEENGELGVLSRGPIEEEKESEKQGPSDNRTQRKHKSIADILGGSLHSKEKVGPPKRRTSNLVESSPVVKSGGLDEKINENGEGNKEKKRMRKKKREILSSETRETEIEESKQQKVGSVHEIEAKVPTNTRHVSRERKKSRYLSPPYTNPGRVDKKGDVTAESLRVSSIVRVGERMTKAAENLIGLCEKLSPKGHTQIQTVDSQIPKRVGGEDIIADMEMKASSANEVLLNVRSLACNPRRILSVDAVEGFLLDFRNSVYIDESKSDMKSREQSGRKRKSQDDVSSESNGQKVKSRSRKLKKTSVLGIENAKLHPVPISYHDGQTTNDLPSPGTKRQKKRGKKTNEPVLSTLNMKKASESKPTDPEKSDKGSSLVVSFGPGSSLPTKEDLPAFKNTSKSAQLEKSKKPVSAATPKSEASEVDAIKERLQVVTSMLDKSGGKLSKKMRAQLEGELKGVLEKISAD
ncbi:hypothetical protein SAY87_003120 [Trapa incisa]|uniref:PWWP domain-containing protein n=1 Tax=Trapa incisa TaxID=236973 RepID=A0AAN7KIM7_9MYRT|nr:hypothetical protein SAY87_003120 [Trapa incisa]